VQDQVVAALDQPHHPEKLEAMLNINNCAQSFFQPQNGLSCAYFYIF
jgi:hypothetical protein